MTKAGLDQAIANVQGAVMMAYPMGLPDGETVKDILDDNEDLSGTAVLGLFSRFRSIVDVSSWYQKIGIQGSHASPRRDPLVGRKGTVAHKALVRLPGKK